MAATKAMSFLPKAMYGSNAIDQLLLNPDTYIGNLSV
jgi:hypothetical protein